jgi:putative FmdB family regulatory protein
MLFETIGKPREMVKRKEGATPNTKDLRTSGNSAIIHLCCSGVGTKHETGKNPGFTLHNFESHLDTKSFERKIIMPIFEFRCNRCNEVFEILQMGTVDEVEMKCPHCGSENFERVLSTTSYAVGAGKVGSRESAVQSRECASGTCSTVTLPGHSRD